MLGCHNCPHRPIPGTAYEDSPCATCRTRNNPPPESHYRDDPGTYQVLKVQHPALEKREHLPGVREGGDMHTFLHSILRAFSQSLRVLVQLKEKHPQTYRILDAKLEAPHLSYTELAERFSCRKQNVQYHLKKAVSFCPELSQALIIDTRYTSGYSAVKKKKIFHK